MKAKEQGQETRAAGVLDPQAADFLQSLAQMNVPPFSSNTPQQARELARALNALLAPAEPVAKCEDSAIPGPAGPIPVRIYTPEGEGPFPILVYYHGGGFVICDLDTHDNSCRSLANGASCVVVSVDYRLAPEHKFPAAVEDAYAALEWAAANAASINGDPSRIAVAGDSAGGNLAAVVALMARDRGGPGVVYQLLIYPATDLASDETASFRDCADGYLFTRADAEWFRDCYLRSEDDARDPLASPSFAENLSGLPPALVITAEFDVLRDQGEAYAKRLQEAGVPARYSRYEGMFHGFMLMDGVLDRARDAMAEATAALREAFQRGG